MMYLRLSVIFSFFFKLKRIISLEGADILADILQVGMFGSPEMWLRLPGTGGAPEVSVEQAVQQRVGQGGAHACRQDSLNMG